MWLLSTVGRDWWAKAMQRYGKPFPVISVDGNNAQLLLTVKQFLLEADDIGGLILPEKGTATWSPAMTAGIADAHKSWQDFCQGEVSKMLVGQTQSAKPSGGGLNDGQADQAEAVRGDIKSHDGIHINLALQNQLFRQILDLNGYYTLPTPRASFGAMTPKAFKEWAGGVSELNKAGIRPTEFAVAVMSEKSGIQLERFNAAEEAAQVAEKYPPKEKPGKEKEGV
jgi:phage gp29-like protein